MKKLIISAFAITLMALGSAGATNMSKQNLVVVALQEKVAVKPEDLPEAVKTTLKGEAYTGWEVTGAFLVTKEDKSQYFEIAVKKGEETATVNLDKDGKKVE